MRSRALVAGAACALSLAVCSVPAHAESPRPDRDYFENDRGVRVPFTPTYESWFGGARYRANYTRAILENVATTALELAIYWYDPSLNVVDWQFPSLDSKLSSSEAVRFDDNLLSTNYIHHPIAGSTHYILSRVNGFGIPGSFAASAIASTGYEFLFEWRELVSINDLIVTPFGGTAMGEFFHQLGNYLNSAPRKTAPELVGNSGTFARGAAKTTFGVFRNVHDELDDPPEPPPEPLDNLGLSTAYGHDFALRFQEIVVENPRGRRVELYGVRGEFELAAMPGMLRPGVFQRWFSNGNFTRFDFEISANGRSRENLMRFDSHLFGYYAQSARTRASARAFEAALASGLTYRDRQWAGERDQFGIVHLPHPAAQAWLPAGPARLRLGADVSADFGSIHSAAFRTYAARFGVDGTKSSLSRHGYLHTWGLSAGAAASLRIEDVELGGSARYGRYESIDGVEREQEHVVRDMHGVETIRQLGVTLALEPRNSSVAAWFEFAETRRSSRLGNDLDEVDAYRRASVSLGLHF